MALGGSQRAIAGVEDGRDDRLGDVRVHAGIARVVLVFARRMGGHGDDRQVAQPWVGPDDAAGGQPVHDRHLDVHEGPGGNPACCSRSTASLAVVAILTARPAFVRREMAIVRLIGMSLDQQHRSPDQRGKAVACGGGLMSGLAFGRRPGWRAAA